MPNNGETNKKFGVYKSLCCGLEIVIAEAMTFPVCPNHPKLTTVWTPINTEIQKFPVKKPGNAA